MKKILPSIALVLAGLVGPAAAQVSPVQTPDNPTLPAAPKDIRSDAEVWEEGALFQAFGLSMFAASAGDIATTEWGLSRPGIYEANPFVGNRGVRLSTHALVPVAVWWTTKRLHRDGHDRAALWVRIAVTAAYGYAVMHNLRTAGSPPLP